MPIVLLRFPPYQPSSAGRPRACPSCGSEILQSWGQVTRTISDVGPRPVTIRRFRCSNCGRTFREYPPEIDRGGLSDRVRALARAMTTIGMSSRALARLLERKGIQVSHTTLWRDARNSEDPTTEPKYVIASEVSLKSKRRLGVVVAVDFGDGVYEVLGTLDEINPRLVKAWLEPLLSESGIEVIDLATGLLTDQMDQNPPKDNSSTT